MNAIRLRHGIHAGQWIAGTSHLPPGPLVPAR
jgi:hypothetical protein